MDKRKVGQDLSKAILQAPNCTKKFQDVEYLNTKVMKGPVLNGVALHMKEYFLVDTNQEPIDVASELIKRFFEHNSQFSFSEDQLLELSCDFWVENHVQAIKGKKEILDLLRKEMMRAQNVYIVGCIKKEVGKEIKVDVNLSTDEFIKRIYSSPSQDITEIVKNINIKNYDE